MSRANASPCDRRKIAFCLEKKRVKESQQRFSNAVQGVDYKKNEIGGHQFVATAAGVEFPAERAKFFDQSFLYEMVNILGGGAKGFDPGVIPFRARGYFVESREGLPHFAGAENADGFKRPGPGAIHSDFIGQQPAIEPQGILEGVE